MDTYTAAILFKLSDRRIRKLCSEGRIVSKRTGKPAELRGRLAIWHIPDDPRILTPDELRAKTGVAKK